MTTRREALKLTGAAALGLLATGKGTASPIAPSPATPRTLKVAGYAYDRVQAIKDGSVGLDQAVVSFHDDNIYSMNGLVFGPQKTYEVTEVGLIPYVTKFINEGFRGYTLVPVFISRTFRHRNIYVHVDSGIEKPEDLRGRKVGTPGYGSSANTWVRGMLHDQYGLAASDIRWVESAKSSDIQGAVSDSSGSGSRYQLPKDFPLAKGPPGVDESELLMSGICDALITPITPQAFQEGNPKIRQMFAPLKSAEQQYYRDTGLFPIMHAVAVRADVANDTRAAGSCVSNV